MPKEIKSDAAYRAEIDAFFESAFPIDDDRELPGDSLEIEKWNSAFERGKRLREERRRLELIERTRRQFANK